MPPMRRLSQAICPLLHSSKGKERVQTTQTERERGLLDDGDRLRSCLCIWGASLCLMAPPKRWGRPNPNEDAPYPNMENAERTWGLWGGALGLDCVYYIKRSTMR